MTGVFAHAGGATINTNNLAYTIAAPISTPVGYGVSSVAISAGGSNYAGAPAVIISGGSGAGATRKSCRSRGRGQ